MSLRSCVRWAARYWISTLVVGLVVGILGGVSFKVLNSPDYTSSATITMKAVEKGETGPGVQSVVQQLSASALTLFTSPRTLGAAGQSLSPPMSSAQLQQAIMVRSPTQSLLFTATVTTGKAERSEAIMNAVSREFKKAVEDGELPAFGNVELQVGSIAIGTEVAAETVIGRVSSFVVGAALGFLVALTYLFTRVLINDRIWSVEDLHELTDDAVLGVGRSGSLTDVARSIKEGLPFFVPGGGPKTIAISSIDGSSAALSREIATQVASGGERVALIDADLITRPLGEGQPGLADAVAGLVPAVEASSNVGGVNVVLAGGPAPNPIDLLTRKQATEFISTLAESHQWVIINTATLIDSSAGAVGAKLAAVTLLVADAGSTTRQNLRDALGLAKVAKIQVGGIVLA